jgi:hypothetical protein
MPAAKYAAVAGVICGEPDAAVEKGTRICSGFGRHG